MGPDYHGMTIVFFVLMAYFLPAAIARMRQHPYFIAIAILNTLLGWTVIGWIASLAWACRSIEPRGNFS